MKLVNVDEMRAIEKEADASGLTYAQMMENAGSSLARIIQETAYSHVEERSILGLVGPGNNGGDALVALAILAANDWHVRAYLIQRVPDGDPLVRRLEEADGEVILAEKDKDFLQLATFIEDADILLDGVLGTGIRLPLKGAVAAKLEAARRTVDSLEWPPYVVAVDCPSGVDCDSGESAPQAIPADMTITMAAVKQGLLNFPAHGLVGELQVVGIGLPDHLPAWESIRSHVADATTVQNSLPERSRESHKGTFGTALIVAGSVNYTGAAYLAGKAAYRCGAGLVTLAVPAPLHSILAGQLPEATWLLLPHDSGVIAREAAEVLVKNMERATAMLVGPGFGVKTTTGEFVESLVKGFSAPKRSASRIGFVQDEISNNGKTFSLPPLVIDADGLTLLAKIDNWYGLLPTDTILTPHPGEMAGLTGLTIEEIQANRREIAAKYAREWNQILVLKGAFTVIAAPDGRTTTIPVATPALARAGTGDVLAGLIVGLRAQGMGAYDAAVAGAWIHAQAGLYALEAVGSSASVLAGDVLDCVNDVMADLA